MSKFIFGIAGVCIGGIAGVLGSRSYFKRIADEEVADVKKYYEDKITEIAGDIVGSLSAEEKRREPEESATHDNITAIYKTETTTVDYHKLKPDLSELAADIEEKEDYNRFEILDDCSTEPNDECSIVDIEYDPALNTFSNEDGVIPDISELIGEEAVGHFIMGSAIDSMSVLDKEWNILYEIETIQDISDKADYDDYERPEELPEDKFAPKSPRERMVDNE